MHHGLLIALLLSTMSLASRAAVTLYQTESFNTFGGWFVTGITPVPRFGGWSSTGFDLRPTALTAVSGGTNAAATMAGVTDMRILHSSAADHQGAVVSGILLVDNLRAVPEPSSFGLLAASLLVFLKRKR